VSWHEFASRNSSFVHCGQQQTEEQLRSLFDSMDADGDGSLTIEELRRSDVVRLANAAPSALAEIVNQSQAELITIGRVEGTSRVHLLRAR